MPSIRDVLIITSLTGNQRGGDYHHLSSFENSKKDDSLLDECYLKDSENLVEDTLKSVSETPEQVTKKHFKNSKKSPQKCEM